VHGLFLFGLRHHDRAAAARAAAMRQRGKPGGFLTNAIARRANRIAFVMVRDQVPYDPTRWTLQE
jgi:transposase